MKHVFGALRPVRAACVSHTASRAGRPPRRGRAAPAVVALAALALLGTACGQPQTAADQATTDGQTHTADSATARQAPTPSDDIASVAFGQLPAEIDTHNARLCNVPGRQQHTYFSADGTIRLVLEVQDADEDTIPAEELQAVTVGEADGVLYRCAEGTPQLAESDNVAQGLAVPQPGEWVVEWPLGDCQLRLYGNLSGEVLLATAQNVVEEP